MPYKGYPDGLYLLKQRSERKGVDHFGIADIGNCLKVAGADGINPVVVHQTPPCIRADWLRDTRPWRVLGRIVDESGAVARYHEALKNPTYWIWNNCEHFASFVATGNRESKQLQSVGWLTGFAALVVISATDDPRALRRRHSRSRLAA
jgi:hypothetical protein